MLVPNLTHTQNVWFLSAFIYWQKTQDEIFMPTILPSQTGASLPLVLTWTWPFGCCLSSDFLNPFRSLNLLTAATMSHNGVKPDNNLKKLEHTDITTNGKRESKVQIRRAPPPPPPGQRQVNHFAECLTQELEMLRSDGENLEIRQRRVNDMRWEFRRNSD